MKKTGVILKERNSDIVHITCLAHLMHNCAMRIKSWYYEVDRMIANLRMVTLRNKTNRKLFNEIGGLPSVVVTRWTSWLRAALFYGENYPKVRNIVLNKLEPDGIIVQNAKEAVVNEKVFKGLVEIYSSYKELVSVVDKFEESKFDIENGYKCIKYLEFGTDPCSIKKYINSRLVDNHITNFVVGEFNGLSPAITSMILKCPLLVFLLREASPC
jgi:hypothetical protein